MGSGRHLSDSLEKNGSKLCIILVAMLCLFQDSEEFLGSNAKKAKVDNGNDKIPEVEETPTSEETEAEA